MFKKVTDSVLGTANGWVKTAANAYFDFIFGVYEEIATDIFGNDHSVTGTMKTAHADTKEAAAKVCDGAFYALKEITPVAIDVVVNHAIGSVLNGSGADVAGADDNTVPPLTEHTHQYVIGEPRYGKGEPRFK